MQKGVVWTRGYERWRQLAPAFMYYRCSKVKIPDRQDVDYYLGRELIQYWSQSGERMHSFFGFWLDACPRSSNKKPFCLNDVVDELGLSRPFFVPHMKAVGPCIQFIHIIYAVSSQWVNIFVAWLIVASLNKIETSKRWPWGEWGEVCCAAHQQYMHVYMIMLALLVSWSSPDFERD